MSIPECCSNFPSKSHNKKTKRIYLSGWLGHLFSITTLQTSAALIESLRTVAVTVSSDQYFSTFSKICLLLTLLYTCALPCPASWFPKFYSVKCKFSPVIPSEYSGLPLGDHLNLRILLWTIIKGLIYSQKITVHHQYYRRIFSLPLFRYLQPLRIKPY